jgi:hypothetical protein
VFVDHQLAVSQLVVDLVLADGFQASAERSFGLTCSSPSQRRSTSTAGSSRSTAERIIVRRSSARRVSTRATTARVLSRPLTAFSLGSPGSLRMPSRSNG